MPDTTLTMSCAANFEPGQLVTLYGTNDSSMAGPFFIGSVESRTMRIYPASFWRKSWYRLKTWWKFGWREARADYYELTEGRNA